MTFCVIIIVWILRSGFELRLNSSVLLLPFVLVNLFRHE